MDPSATEVEEGKKLIALILMVVEFRPHMVLLPYGSWAIILRLDNAYVTSASL